MAKIVLRLSTGSASNDTATTGINSTGGKMGTNAGAIITTTNTTMNNLWDDITKSQNASGTADYRCIYIHNDTAVAAETFSDAQIYLSGSPLATFEFAVAPTKNTAAPVIANETTAPSGVTFQTATQNSPLNLLSSGSLNAGDYIYIWIKRRANNIAGSGSVVDSMTLTIKGSE